MNRRCVFGLGKLLLLLIMLILLITSCVSPESDGFSVYLLAGNISASQLPALSHLELAAQPLVSLGDIVSYRKETHEIELTKEAYERILRLNVPTKGLPFAVCLSRSPVYSGAFWTMLSSMSFDGVVIMKPLQPDERHTIRIELGYPGSDFFRGTDPRANEDIMRSLEKAGKTRSA